MGPVELLILLVVAAVVVGFALVGRRSKTPPAPRPLPGVPIPPELQARIRALAADGQKITAIKELRAATGLGLLDAKNTVEAIAAGGVRPVPGAAPRADLAYRARLLAADGREDEAARLVAGETGMSGPEAAAFVRTLLGA